MDKVKVETSLGTFEMMRPKAGVRNRAMMKAEGNDGNIKRVLFMTEIIPKMISKRPDNCDADVPIEQLLDSMSIEDYDKFIEAVDELVTPADTESELNKKKV